MWQRSKGNTSSFAPYIHLLPTVHHGVPIFFNGEALEMLQYPPLVEQVEKKKAVQSPCFTGTKVQRLIVYLIYWYKSTNTDEMLRYPPPPACWAGEKAMQIPAGVGKGAFGQDGRGGAVTPPLRLTASRCQHAGVLSLLALLVQKYKSTNTDTGAAGGRSRPSLRAPF